MWLLGHTTLSYLIIKLFWMLSNRAGGRTASGTKASVREKFRSFLVQNHFDPLFILLLFTFANWPDFMHAGQYRIYTHNPVAIMILPLLILGYAYKKQLIGRFETVALFAAGIIHMLMDIPFSKFHLYYPISAEPFAVSPGFLSVYDMTAESLLAVMFIAVFAFSDEHEGLAKFMSGNLKKGSGERTMRPRSSLAMYLPIFIFIAFGLFSLMQLLMFTKDFMFIRHAFYWHYLLFFFVFSIFMAILAGVFLKMISYTRKKLP